MLILPLPILITKIVPTSYVVVIIAFNSFKLFSIITNLIQSIPYWDTLLSINIHLVWLTNSNVCLGGSFGEWRFESSKTDVEILFDN